MAGECGVTRRIIDELDSGDIQGDEMEVESGVTPSIIGEFHFWDIEVGDQMEGESDVTRSLIDKFRSSDIQGD